MKGSYIVLQPFCVYEHWLNNKCYYVGSGRLSRPYEYRIYNKKWINIFASYEEWKKIRNNCVVIIKTFDDREEAYEFEKEITIKTTNENHTDVNALNGKSNPKQLNGYKGKKHKKETIQKTSEKRKRKGKSKGKNNPMYGKRSANSEYTYLFKDGNFIREFDTFKKCCEWLKEKDKNFPLT